MGVDVDQFSVKAVADTHRGLQRFDVDIGGAEAECLGECLLDEPDDGCVVGLHARLGVAGGNPEAIIGRIGSLFLDVVKLEEMVVDVAVGCAGEVELPPDDVRQAVEGFEVERVCHGNGQIHPIVGDGDRAVSAGDVLGNR